MPRPDTQRLHEKNAHLQRVGEELKRAFVGIDAVVDQLIDAVRVWFVMPEALSRPIVVNLWGMTGVGKTDLIRRLVAGLEFQHRFLEIELVNSERHSTVTGALNNNNLNDADPKIILFDEVQRFHTLNQKGEPVASGTYPDFWELLSDGRLSRRNRQDLDFLLAELLLRQRRRKSDDSDDEAIDMWDAQQLKRTLGLREDLVDVAGMTNDQLVQTLRGATQAKQVFEPVDHSKTLIIVSGNLDDAFAMANQTAEADVDADIFHAFTAKISLVDIKLALSRRFTPEQVARFGNVHLIYRSLRRVDFEALIAREVTRIERSTREMFGIELTVAPSIHDLIYRNGVFPAQGARLVFSSVADILEANVARFVLDGTLHDELSIALDYDGEQKRIVARFSTPDGKQRTSSRSYVGRLDHARGAKALDLMANVAVHEAGHAVAYGLLFGLAPLQLTARVASAFAAGFTFPHEVHETRDSLLWRIQVFLAGGLAEDIVFGAGRASTGRSSDRETATKLAIDYIRRYGFHATFQATYTLEDAHAMNKDATDTEIEILLAGLVDETRALLEGHKALLLSLSRRLDQEGRLDAHQVAEVWTQHGLEVVVRPEGHLILPPYRAALGSDPRGKDPKERDRRERDPRGTDSEA